VAASIRGAVQAIDKDLPVTDVESFPEVLGASVAQERFRTLLLSSFSAIALILAAVGIFGVMSYSASQRTHEIGIRMALGAHQHEILRLILAQGAKLAFLGLGAGAVAALLLTRLMARLLYGVSATDPLTFGVVTTVLLGVALIACYTPARRAMSVDPMIALRHE
jgi:putative ABC transport system permease protein